MAKIEKNFFASIWLQFSKKLIRNLKKNFLLRGRATLPLWFKPKHNYVGPAVTEWIYEPVGLICAGFSAVGLFLGRKSKISHKTQCFYFSILHTHAKFQSSRFNNKKKYLKVADPLKSISFIRPSAPTTHPMCPSSHKLRKLTICCPFWDGRKARFFDMVFCLSF